MSAELALALPADAAPPLHDVVRVVRDVYCGKGRPFAGMLVLFDEFGRYMEFAVQKPGVAGPGALQQLHEAVQAEGAPAQQALARAAAERAKHLRVDQAGFLAPQPAGSPAPRRAPRCLSWIREGYRDMGDYIVYEGNLR